MSAWLLLAIRLALTVLLYLFLGWAVLTLWLDLRRQAESTRKNSAATAIKLQLDTETGVQTFQFTKNSVTIGRDPGCDFPLDDKTVSNRHTRLSFHHNQWWVEDLGSTNGTMLNQEPVSGATVVTNGDLLECGQIKLNVEICE